jgi:predicted ATPase/transcriptional regulator with XRE-family HTH domain
MTDTLAGSLKQLRAASGMTQEELAERAGISARTVSDLERGLRTVVHQETARRLASALGLGDQERAQFETLARGRVAALEPAARPSALPVPPTRLLGRARELDSIKATIKDPDVRLLTLTGPGGIGKSRLALEAAAEVPTLFADGVFFASLGELQDASLVAPELAKAIGVVETGPELVKLLTNRLSGREALVVLDTFEHLTPAAPLVYSLLLSCPESTFLVTSRSALRLRGEHEFPVQPLELPSATALFWERAHAVRPELEVDAASAALVTEICRKLDGLPLALELAAARVKHLPLAAIREQLEDRLQLLVGGPLDLPLRQRAIRDTVGWSHDLLGPREQRLFRRLSVFAGGFSADAVTAVCGSLDEVGDALEGISTLVDQSLVVLERNRSDARYDMLDVVREYGAAQLSAAGETEAIERAHALHYLALSEAAEPLLVGTGHAEWFRRLDLERGNLRRGLAWTVERGEAVLALRYIVALWRYWRQLGEFAEGRRWSGQALTVAGQSPPSLRAKALWAASALAFPQGDHARMAEMAAEAIELAGQSADPMDRRNALTILGMVAMLEARWADALEPYGEGVAIASALGTTWHLGTSHLNFGTALLHSGRIEEAVAAFESALGVYRELGDDVFAARVLNHLAQAALAGNQIDRADRLAREALTSVAELGERQGMVEGLQNLAAVAAARSEVERAAALAGAAAAIRETIAARAAPFDVAIAGRLLDRAEARGGATRWRRGWERGRALDPAAAIALALAP